MISRSCGPFTRREVNTVVEIASQAIVLPSLQTAFINPSGTFCLQFITGPPGTYAQVPYGQAQPMIPAAFPGEVTTNNNYYAVNRSTYLLSSGPGGALRLQCGICRGVSKTKLNQNNARAGLHWASCVVYFLEHGNFIRPRWSVSESHHAIAVAQEPALNTGRKIAFNGLAYVLFISLWFFVINWMKPQNLVMFSGRAYNLKSKGLKSRCAWPLNLTCLPALRTVSVCPLRYLTCVGVGGLLKLWWFSP